MPLPLLLPNTPLPSGWSIDPVTGNCIRISDGAQFGRATSQAIAWSARDVESRYPDITGPAVDIARLRNAIGCALRDTPFTGNARQDRAAVDDIHASGNRLAGDAASGWRWQSEDAVGASFNQRLGCLLDAIGVDQAHHPAPRGSTGEVWLLTGSIGDLAVRSELTVRDGADARLALVAQACGDAGTAMQRARAWAIEAVRRYVAESANAALDFLHRIPFHGDDIACARLIDELGRLRADCVVPTEAGCSKEPA